MSLVDEDRANVAGSQPAGAMMLRWFEVDCPGEPQKKFLLWDSAVAAGKLHNENVYEVFQDGTFYKVYARKETADR